MELYAQSRSTAVPMHEETLPSEGIRLADYFASKSFTQDFYLVGGTALALQIGHRESVDLDFFSQQTFDAHNWLPHITDVPEKENLTLGENHLKLDGNPTKVEFIHFAYPPHYPLLDWRGLRMIDAKDIGLFKLLALIGRNRKKDIIDLWFIDREVKPLQQVVADFFHKYDQGDINLLKQMEGLFDDENVARSDMPKMLKPVNWQQAYEEVKTKIAQAIKKQLGF